MKIASFALPLLIAFACSTLAGKEPARRADRSVRLTGKEPSAHLLRIESKRGQGEVLADDVELR